MVDEEIDHDSPNYMNDVEHRKTEFVKNDPPSFMPRKTKAQIWEDTVLQFKNIFFLNSYKLLLF